MTWTVVCGTGHRPQHLPAESETWARVEAFRVCCRLRDEYDTTTIVSGMALGWDMWLARAALEARLRLWAHIPFPQQPDRWPPAQQGAWRLLRDRAHQVTTYGDSYDVGLLHARNDGMLGVSAAVVALHDPAVRTGGTVSAVRKAEERGLPIIRLNPVDRSTTWPEVPATLF